jgi:hypothetical protein
MRCASWVVGRVMAVAAFALPIDAALAQRVVAPAIGARVRIKAPPPNEWREGNLSLVDSTQIILRHPRADGSGDLETIPRSAVQAFEISDGRPGSGERFVFGFLIGGLGGLLVGGYLGYAATDNCTCEDPGFGVFPGGLLGLLLGSISTGVVLAGRTPERWRAVPVPR